MQLNGTESDTFPKMVCLLFNSGVAAIEKKNWLPLSFGPEFAMATRPLLTNLNLECNSSWNKTILWRIMYVDNQSHLWWKTICNLFEACIAVYFLATMYNILLWYFCLFMITIMINVDSTRSFSDWSHN